MASNVDTSGAAAAAASQRAQQAASSTVSNEAIQEAYNSAKSKSKDDIDANLYGRPSNRRAWTLTTSSRKANNESPMKFYVNPGQYTMDTPIRQSVVQAKGGPVVHNFRDPKRGNSNLGFTTMSIDFSSGSILPRPSADSSYAEVPEGLLNWIEYLKIIQEDTVYRDTSDNTIKPNNAILTINTLMFPNLEIEGTFIENVSHSENSDDPTQIQSWSGKLLIRKTTPALTLDEINNLKNSWLQNINNSGNE